VLARHGDIVTRGILFDDFDIGGQTRPGECPFEEIVAEQRALRHPVSQGGLERVHVVDALAGIGAFAEQVLVHIGNGRRVRVDTAHAGKDALEQRSFATDRQRWGDARLQQPVAFDDVPAAASNRGRLSGCAILPTSLRTVSRGNRVSESSVMT